MPLSIIKGPPNSGRTELVRERFEARLVDNPVLVVPSTDDIFGWERRLTRKSGAFLGGKVVHFKDLIDEILETRPSSSEVVDSELASPLARRALAKQALQEGWSSLASLLPEQPGLIDATLAAIDDFRENLIGPNAFEDEGVAAEVGPIAEVYRSYLQALEASGKTDLPEMAVKASSIPLDAWQGRPVFVAGFDDLSPRQRELIRRLAEETEVTVAMTHERGNQAMAVTEGMLGKLLEIGGEVVRETSRPQAATDHAQILADLERSFLNHDQDGSLLPSEELTLIEASGKRGEAEAIGAEVARLVDGGVDPGEIAIAIDSPARNGIQLFEVLGEYGIPATLEAETTAAESATGQTVLNLLKARTTGDARTLLAYLRGPLGLDSELVDRLEFRLRRTGTERAEAAAKIASEIGLELPGWGELTRADAPQATKLVARLCAENLIEATGTKLPGAAVATETQMCSAICRAVDELEKLNQEPADPAQIIDALLSGEVKTWAVLTAHTVQIASPYSLRAKRVEYLFIASLQEKDLGSETSGPLMSSRARSSLGMPDLTDQEQQETYLFYSCLSVPTKGLWLSHRVADVHGKAEFPSAMIGEVCRLFEGDGVEIRKIRRTSSDIVFSTEDAPSPHELALAEVAAGGHPAETELVGEVARARLKSNLTEEFRDLDSDAVRPILAGETMFSASALEAFIECPYRWFFERAMSPTRFGPDPEAIARGNLIHLVLADLYRAHRGELPSEDDLETWIEEMTVLVKSKAAACDLGEDSAGHRIQRRQAATEMSRFLRRESNRKGFYRPFEFEAAFGFNDDESKPPLDFGDWQLRGSIDRIDRDPAGNAVVIDYKSGASSYKSLAQIKREGKLQLQLYLKAAEEHWGLTPAGGLYVPVFAAKAKARGVIDGSKASEVKEFDFVRTDSTDQFDEELTTGLNQAAVAAQRMLRGEIHHDPADCLNHFHHAGVPDWNPGDESESSPQ